MDEKAAAIILELEKRNRIYAGLFNEQNEVIEAIQQPHARVACLTSRRAGKTYTSAVAALDTCRRIPEIQVPYISLTGPSARNIVLPVIKKINDKYKLGCKFNASNLTITLPNDSMIPLFGADREDLQDRLLGSANAGVIIDECAAFRTNLRKFITETIEPTLADYRGFCMLISTPGTICFGYFYDITQPEHKLREPGWNVKEWKVENNPYMKQQYEEILERELVKDPDVLSKPWFRRQWRGEWVDDTKDRVYSFTSKNIVSDWKQTEKNFHVLGVDTGYSDGMAFVVTGWHPEFKKLAIYESYWKPKMSMDEIARKINQYRDKYDRLYLVGDPNNAQLIADLIDRYSIPIEKAEKTDKRTWIRIINNSLENEEILILRENNEQLIKELSSLKRLYQADNTWKEDKTTSTNHCCDALLYAFRYSYHYRSKAPRVKPQYGTQAYEDYLEEKIFQEEQRYFLKRNKRKWFER